MADNFTTGVASGGATFAADDIGGVLWPRLKVTFGADGAAADVTASAGLPVAQQSGAVFTVVGAAADGAAVSGNPVLVAGFDGTNAQSISVTAGGLVQIHDGAGSLTVDNGGTFAVQATEADGANVTLGAKADAKSTATDTTAVTLMSVAKQISASTQASASSLAGTLTVGSHAVTIASGATSIAKAEDVASADADVGVGMLAVRKATPANTSGTDGDYEFLQMSAGRLWASATIDAALPAGTNAIGKLAANDGVDIGDTTINNASGASAVNIQDGGNSITVDGTVAVSGTVTVDSELTTADLDTGAGTDTRAVVGVVLAASGGGALAPGDATKGMKVQITDGSGAQITSFGGGVEYAEDTAHSSGDTGKLVLAVRRDANTTLVDTTGDYAPLQVDSAGSLKVAITAGAGSGGTSIADDAAFTIASTSITPVGGVYAGTLDAVDDGDAGAFHMTQKRAMHVNLRDNSGNEVSVGGGTQYDEDAASAGAEKLTLAGAVRRDTAASSSGTDGDYSTLNTDATGRLWAHVGTIDGGTITTITNAVAVTGTFWQATQPVSGTVAVTNADLTTLAGAIRAEDAASADGHTGMVNLAVRKATPANTSGTDGDYEMLQMSAGRLWTSSTIDAALPAGTNNIGDVDVLTVPADPFGANADAASATGSISAKLRFIAATGIPITGTVTVGSHAVTNAGTFAVQAVDAGDTAHDGADTGNPVKIGARARSSEIAAVANNDRSDLVTDLVGKLITLPYANPENFVSGAITTAMTGTTTTSLIAAPAAGLRNYITQITVSNSHATVGTDIVIQDGSGGTTLYTIPAAAVYGGATLTFPVPLRQPTTATAIFCANVTTGASTKVSASGYKGA